MIQLVAPNGTRISGTAETVQAVAHVSGWNRSKDGKLEPIYEGGTEVDWDSQATRLTTKGSLVVVDDDGDEWALSACKIKENDDGN